MPEKTRSPNALLAALPEKEYKKLESKLERFELVYDTDIYIAGHVIEHVYFPESGIISVLAVVGSDSSLEVGIVGDEGMIGLPVFLGETVSNNRAVVQGAGFAMRMTPKDLLYAAEHGPKLQQILKKFTHWMMTQISQSAACNRYHPIEARLARWLLMTRDRMRSDEFRITQEFLSNMIGVRREAVNKAASDLQQRGLISYIRGSLSILQVEKLEKLPCSCYEIISRPTV